MYDSSIPIERPGVLNLFNFAGRLAETVGLRPFDLRSERILAKAESVSGFEYRDAAFEQGLARLVQSMNGEARFNAFGKFANKNILQRGANARFQVEKAIAENSAILDEPITEPVFIIGMPRSGTTILQALLYRDAAHRSPLSWECILPWPAPTPANYQDNPRLESIRKEFEQLFRLVPDFRKKHYMTADSPQECLAVTALNFCSFQYVAQAYVPSYLDWFGNDADQLLNLRWHKRFLQFLQSGGIRPERWLLKTPVHLMRLKQLFEIYPDARIVMPHREPSRVVASAASLVSSMRSLYSDHEDSVRTGRESLKVWSDYLDRFLRDRKEMYRDDQIVDFHFDDFVGNQMEVVDSLYARFGWTLAEQGRARMEEFLRTEQKDKHGAHEYTLEQFGISAADIRRHFADYLEFLEDLKQH